MKLSQEREWGGGYIELIEVGHCDAERHKITCVHEHSRSQQDRYGNDSTNDTRNDVVQTTCMG